MKRFYSNVCSAKTALQQRPEVLYALSVYVALNVTVKMVHDLMSIVIAQCAIAWKFISHDSRTIGDIFAHDLIHQLSVALADDLGTNFSATLKHSENSSLGGVLTDSGHALTASLVHIPCFAADESFVSFDCSIRAAEFTALLILQSKANAVQHEPRGFLRDFD